PRVPVRRLDPADLVYRNQIVEVSSGARKAVPSVPRPVLPRDGRTCSPEKSRAARKPTDTVSECGGRLSAVAFHCGARDAEVAGRVADAGLHIEAPGTDLCGIGGGGAAEAVLASVRLTSGLQSGAGGGAA